MAGASRSELPSRVALGLVDFPALRDGEEIYLCWVVGEPEIRHWHEPDAGFRGRRPL